MSGIWMISYLSLWILVALLFFAVLTLARQVGILHRRLGPTGARMTNMGLAIGEPAPQIDTLDLNGREVTLGSARNRPTLMLFFTTTCSTCAELTPAIRSLYQSERNKLDIILVSMFSDEKETRSFLKRHKLTALFCTNALRVAIDYQVNNPPYGILIDSGGVVQAKGIVNNAEHLESLLNVMELGYASIQKWYTEQHASAMKLAADASTR